MPAPIPLQISSFADLRGGFPHAAQTVVGRTAILQNSGCNALAGIPNSQTEQALRVANLRIVHGLPALGDHLVPAVQCLFLFGLCFSLRKQSSDLKALR